MDVINRNFFKLLRSGGFNKYEALEPMSPFKWMRLMQIARFQIIMPILLKGIRNHQYDENLNIPKNILDEMSICDDAKEIKDDTYDKSQLSSLISKRILNKIRKKELKSTNMSKDTLAILNIIVYNIYAMLNKGISLRGIIDLGKYLRIRGNNVDYDKLDKWLSMLHIRKFAQLEGSILIYLFKFDIEEIPFVKKQDKTTEKLTLRTISHTAIDTAKEWHFKQSRSGFVRNNSAILRRNLRRSMPYLNYAPAETISNFITNFARSLSEIEE